jgi:hemerythrin-like domain-containing protein
MNQPHPTETLMNEHRVIERVLRAIEAELPTLGKPPFPRDFFDRALDFLSNFADGCHHAKEEERLFPALEKKGVPKDGGPIGVMLFEHTQGRACLAAIRLNLDAAERGDPQALTAIRRSAESYVHLLREHIWKEDNILFQMARRLLSDEEAAEISNQFHCMEEHHIGAGVHERYLQMADELAAAPALRS